VRAARERYCHTQTTMYREGRKAVKAYIIRVTENCESCKLVPHTHGVRLFVTIALDFEQALYNVKAENSFWDTDRYLIRIVTTVTGLDGVSEIPCSVE
jgi:hypothetical protein